MKVIAVIQRQSDGINYEMSSLELSSLIDYLSEKTEIIKGLNEKIISQCYDIEKEILESE